MLIKKIKQIIKKLFNKDVFFALLISELFEEVLEELIATGITWVIGKVINVIAIVIATQTLKLAFKGIGKGTKILIKRIVKKFTYKEGNDKMKVLNKIWSCFKKGCLFTWNNKLTGVMVSVGVYAGYSFYLGAYLPYLWANIAGGIIIGLIAAILSIKFGGETLTQIINRINAKKLTKEQQKEAELKAEEAKAELARIEAKKAELKAKKEAEAEARLEAEAKALVEQEKALVEQENNVI